MTICTLLLGNTLLTCMGMFGDKEGES